MNLFEETLDEIKKNKTNIDIYKKPNCIPFDWFPKLKTVIPGLMKGTNWLISANSGIGKTQFTKHNFVYEPIKWIKEHPESKLKVKILYFALEESKKEFMYTMISNRLYHEHKISVSVLELQSMFDKGIPNEIVDKIEECRDYFNDLEQYLTIYDTVSNPTGIYKTVRSYSIDNGTHYFYNFKEDKEKKNTIGVNSIEDYNKYVKKEDWAYSHYIPFDEDEYVIVIIDHFGLLQPELGETLHQTMGKMSAEYGRKMITKHFNYLFVNVQQQTAEGEKAEFTKMGDKIEDKFKPSLAGLANNKETQRDAHVVLGLFSPERYGIKAYQNYDVKQLGDKFRTLLVLKNRIGSGYIEDALYFNGKVNVFKELPYPKDMTEDVYKTIKES